jgi:molybdenum cofactor cytidylyltransferase
LNVVGILLAAGSGSRFGSNKLLHALPHGVSMSVQAARNLKSALPRVIAVLRPGADETARVLAEAGCEIHFCRNAAEGMGASLACAVKATPEADGWLVALADMPFVRPTSIGAVRDALVKGADLAAPYFRARRGHPVGIGKRFRGQLEEASGDEGARKLLIEQEKWLVKVPVGDPGVVRDIDRPSDLAPPVIA